MAKARLSSRQRMINLMYLVFIAMLAIQVSPEVLSAFGLMDKKISEANIKLTEANEVGYSSMAEKANEQALKYGPLKAKTDSIRVVATSFYNYIESIKEGMLEEFEDKEDFESMSSSSYIDLYFFQKGVISPNGKEFLNQLESFKTTVTSKLNDRDLVEIINARFETNDVTKKNVTKSWLNYNFEGFPLIASKTKLTQIQADIKATEADALSSLLQGELIQAVSMTNYEAMVVFDKNAYYAGERLSGKIVLGKNDPTLLAERVVLNGREVEKSKIKAGQVILDGPAGSVGDKSLKGSFFFREGDSLVNIPINGGYTVISRPNEAVVSADKMNVVYRGVANPLTISIPGIPSNKVRASAPGLRKVKGSNYLLNPQAGNQVTISVSGTLPDGKPIKTPKTFRIKDIPPAMGSARGQFGTVRMPKSSLGRTPIGAGLPDFVFDLKLKVNSFKVKVPGQVTVIVSGTRFNAQAKKALSKARRGDIIHIFDINASIVGNSSYTLKKVLPVSIELTN